MNASPNELAARVLLPASLIVAVAFLVKGHGETGGGFSAGLVAGLGVLLQYFALGFVEAERRLPWAGWADGLTLGGLVVMAATVLGPALVGRPPVWHLPRPDETPASFGALQLTTAFVFELGVAMAVFGFLVAAVHGLAAQRERDS